MLSNERDAESQGDKKVQSVLLVGLVQTRILPLDAGINLLQSCFDTKK